MWNTARHGILNEDSKVYSLNTYSDTRDTMSRADFLEEDPAITDVCFWGSGSDFGDVSFPSCQDLNYSHTSEKLPAIIDSKKQRHDDTQDSPPVSQIIR
jgi:hypothetical protein